MSRPAFLTPARHNPLSYDYEQGGEEDDDYGEGYADIYEDDYGRTDADADADAEEEMVKSREIAGNQGRSDDGVLSVSHSKRKGHGEAGHIGNAEAEPSTGGVSKRAARLFWSRRETMQQKTSWLEKGENLRKQQANLERGCFNQLFETRTQGLLVDVQKLGSEHRLFKQERDKEVRSITSKLSSFREKTTRLRRQLSAIVQDLPSSSAGSPSRSTPLDKHSQQRVVEDLHSTFDALEADIANFKRSGRSRYQELQHEERLLEREITQFAERCSHWDASGANSCSAILREHKMTGGQSNKMFMTPTSGRTKKSLSSNKRPQQPLASHSTSSRPQEIVDIERRIEELGGRTGGWESRDHATFLRMLSRYNLRQSPFSGATKKGNARTSAPSPGSASTLSDVDQRRVSSMVAYAASKLPHLGSMDIDGSGSAENAVRAHWDWFQEFSSLEEKKRQAVRRWREQRSKPTQSAAREQSMSPSSFVTPKGTSKKGRTPASSDKRDRQRTAWEKRKLASDIKKKELAAWKAQKAAAAAQAEAEKKQEEREVRLARKRAAAQRAVDKEEIAMYRLQREAAEEHQNAVARVLATARGQAPGPPTSKRILRKRHEENMRKVRKKKEEKLKAETEKAERRARLDKITDKVNKRVPSDFSRLTRHTTASAHNVLTNERLDDMEERRKRSKGGHGAAYSSHTGAEFSRGTTFTFSKASSLRVPKWRRVAMS